MTTKVPPSIYTLTYALTNSCGTITVKRNGAQVASVVGGSINGSLGAAYTSNGTFNVTASCGVVGGTVTYH